MRSVRYGLSTIHLNELPLRARSRMQPTTRLNKIPRAPPTLAVALQITLLPSETADRESSQILRGRKRRRSRRRRSRRRKKDREKRKNVDAEGPSGNKVGAWKGALAYCELPSQYRFHLILRNFPSALSRLVLQQLDEMKPG